MWSGDEVGRVLEILRSQMGVPYEIGHHDARKNIWVVKGKPAISDAAPKSFDCSGLSRWIIGQGQTTDGKTIILPHGTRDQLKFCKPVSGNPLSLDLGFADMDLSGEVDHVVIRYSNKEVIEARGHQKNRDYGKVISRPVKVWEDWRGFMGWWRPAGIHDNGHLETLKGAA